MEANTTPPTATQPKQPMTRNEIAVRLANQTIGLIDPIRDTLISMLGTIDGQEVLDPDNPDKGFLPTDAAFEILAASLAGIMGSMIPPSLAKSAVFIAKTAQLLSNTFLTSVLTCAGKALEPIPPAKKSNLRAQPGDRVGAILKADEHTVHLLGYGVLDGDQEHPTCGMLNMTQEKYKAESGGTPYTNPRITLDDGRVVWGFQCWWGPEAKIRETIGPRTVIPATIPEEPLLPPAPSKPANV